MTTCLEHSVNVKRVISQKIKRKSVYNQKLLKREIPALKKFMTEMKTAQVPQQVGRKDEQA